MNMLQDAADWFADQLADYLSVTIQYTRRSQTSDDIAATVVLHEYEVIDADGIMVTIKSRDYILRATDLVIGSTTITPRSGDQITETVGGTSMTFEVMPLGAQKEYEPVDTDNLMIRIHTKRVG